MSKEFSLKNFVFVKSVINFSDLPLEQFIEIGFIGRSNVGKSSIINAVLGTKNAARVSNTPGRTQMLNYFNIENKAYLVDMPGYGYANAPKKEINKWNKLTMYYLLNRKSLKRIFILIDSRFGIKDIDNNLMNNLDQYAIPYQIILTKIDKISKNDLICVKERTLELLKLHPACYPVVLESSAEKKIGIEEIKLFVTNLILDKN